MRCTPKIAFVYVGNHDFRWFPTFVEQICCCPHHFAPHFERFSTRREQCMVSDSMCCFRRKSTAFPMAFPMKYGHVRREFSHPFSDEQGAMSYELTRTTMRFRGCWSCRYDSDPTLGALFQGRGFQGKVDGYEKG